MIRYHTAIKRRPTQQIYKKNIENKDLKAGNLAAAEEKRHNKTVQFSTHD